MANIISVGLGGFIGSICRYLLGKVSVPLDFPFMTFVINFIGAVIIGIIAEVAMTAYGKTFPKTELFLKTGFCGGFTTFSTFSLETVNLFNRGKYITGGLYALSSVVCCFFGVLLGRFFGAFIISKFKIH